MLENFWTAEAGAIILVHCLRGVERDDVQRGQVLSKPGSVTPHTEFECQAYILKKEEGGRHTPFFTKQDPQFYFRTTDVTGELLFQNRNGYAFGDDGKFSVVDCPVHMSQKTLPSERW